MKLLKTTVMALAIAFGQNLQAQALKVPAPSPAQTIKQAFALSDITIDYSRPSAKGRVVFGDLVPFGKIWRTGANNATKITFGEDVKVEGQDVKAGTYAIYSIPNKDSWDIMLYKDLNMGGDVSAYKKEDEVLRFVVKPAALNEKVETFAIQVTDITSNSANVEMVWEKTRVAFKVRADIDAKIMKAIETNVVKDNRPYYQAARYYYENDKDLILAGQWADKAVEANPKAYWVVLLKAKIQLKAGDKKGAATTAQQVITLAKEDKNDDYVKMGQEIIDASKK
ncbi:MAG: DUF2911 domain-containing protein [Bacteroidia bacterium]|jgi:hypothetical protein|nr:DUF2911 domain-containing protein [Bacteroidia bacterium]